MIAPSVDYTEIQKSISVHKMEDVYREVERLKNLTSHIPSEAKKEPGAFQKAYRPMSDMGPNRGPKSAFFDPLSLQYAMGYKDRRYSLTYDVLKRCANQLSIVAAIINTRIAQIASFAAPYRTTKSLGYMVKHKDPEHMTTKSEREFIKHIEAFVANCGEPGRKNPYSRTSRDDFESFLKKVVRDTLMYDQLCFETVPRNNGIPFEFIAVDAATIRIASTDRDSGIGFSYHARNPTSPLGGRFAALYENKQYGAMAGTGYGFKDPISDHDVQYVQIVNGQIENVYSEDELAFGVRNPRTDIYIQGYGYGEIEQLITIVTSLLFSEEYNKRYFTQGSHPKGLLNFKGDNWTPDQLEAFKRQWIATVAGVENAWKTPITQSEGIEWINLQMTNKDMEFSTWIEYLIKIICGVYLIDPAEINFDLHGGVQQTPLFESSQEWKLKASRDRGLKPLLRFIAKLINKYIVDKIDDHFVFEFVGLDELTEQEKHELIKEQIASYMTLNEARRTLDLPDIPLGDVPINPTYVQLLQMYNQNVQQQQQMAQQQEQQQQQMQMQQQAQQQQQQMQPGAQPGAVGGTAQPDTGSGVPGSEGVPPQPTEEVPEQGAAPGQGVAPGQGEVPPGQGPVPGEEPDQGPKYTANFGKSMREIVVTFDDWIDQKRSSK